MPRRKSEDEVRHSKPRKDARPERPCEHCGGPISPSKPVTTRFCSRQCWKSHEEQKAGGHVSCVCRQCGTTFSLTANRVESGGGQFCSDACRNEAKRRPLLSCPLCETVFGARVVAGGKRQQFCSKTCAGLARRTRVVRTCLSCGTTFTVALCKVLEGKGIYCSKSCAFPGPLHRTCEKCGKDFDAAPNEVAKGWGRFCSNECRRTRVERTCVTCGTGFEVEQAKFAKGLGKYCSGECRGLARRNRKRQECPICLRTFETPVSQEWTCCSRECATEARRQNPQQVERVRRMQHDQIVSRRATRCELALYRYMDDVFGPEHWFREAYVLDKWTVDAFVPRFNLVVQADGDWWHGFFPTARKNSMVKGNMGRDQGQNNYLAEVGWPIIRLWEHELLEDQDGCVERLAETKKHLEDSRSSRL